ncbi:MAG: hypothetical protein K9W46_05310 [Candidatus Heimdallarchaeum endolithica]|uniref:Uncharacterized protein n=1 Tax=Candidatus Heimdallarchaeum endolithica TaxID=2876572 RepID=A0A9Y1BT57_9ARCH|nr:MAG: hypothetical protein K9W46_05310 [Candidatus Heimdallarchaeum endolithica]
MFKLKTFKGRKSFFGYSSLVTICVIFLLLFGSVYATVLLEKEKKRITIESDINSDNIGNYVITDLSFSAYFDEQREIDFKELFDFYTDLEKEGELKYFKPYIVLDSISFNNEGITNLFSTFSDNISCDIIGVPENILLWMFPEDNLSSIHFSKERYEKFHLENFEELAINFSNSSEMISVGKPYNKTQYIFDNWLFNNPKKVIVSLDLFRKVAEERNLGTIFVYLYIDCDSDLLLKMTNPEIESYYEEIYSTIHRIADENNLILNDVHTKKEWLQNLRENLYRLFGGIQTLLAPTYILLIIIMCVTLVESFLPLRKEINLFYTRGAKSTQFVKHYSFIFIAVDLSGLIILSLIGELFSVIFWQTHSFFTSLIIGVSSLFLLEIIKIAFLFHFVNEEYKEKDENKKRDIKNEENILKTKNLIFLLVLVALLLFYSVLVSLFLPPMLFATFIQISRIIALVLLLFVVAILSFQINYSIIIQALQKFFSSMYYGISKIITSLITKKRRRFQLLTILSFWMITFSTFALNSYGINEQYNKNYWMSRNLDIGFYVDSYDYNYFHFDNWTKILMNPEIESYIPTATVNVIRIIQGEELNRGTLVFIPFQNISRMSLSFFSLIDSKGKNFDLPKNNKENYTLVSSKAMYDMGYVSGTVLEKKIKVWGRGYDFNISQQPQSINLTVWHDFSSFPLVEYEPDSESSGYYDHYYIVDFSLMKEIFGKCFFSKLLVKLKDRVDPYEWYSKIKNDLGAMDEHVRVIITKDKIKNYIDFYIILPIEAAILVLAIIAFTISYFQSIVRENKHTLLVALARGTDIKKFKITLAFCTILLLLLNSIGGFIIGTVLSIAWMGNYYYFKVYNVSSVSKYSLIELSCIMLGIASLVTTNSMRIFNKFEKEKENLTTMGEQIW